MKIDVKKDEAAIIFHADGTHELVMPNHQPNDEVPEHVKLAVSITCFVLGIGCEDKKKELLTQLEAAHQSINVEKRH